MTKLLIKVAVFGAISVRSALSDEKETLERSFYRTRRPERLARVAITLKTKKNSVQQASPTYAKYVEDQFEIPERFVMFMQCTSPACGEIVAVMGDVATILEQDADDHSELVEYFAPSFMDPPPPIIAIPKRVPEPVIQEIKLAFQLYWVDYRVCAARLRTSLERLMDHFEVPENRI